MRPYNEYPPPAREAPTVQLPAVPAADARPLPSPASGPAGGGPGRRRAILAGGVAGVVLAAASGGTAAYAYAGDIPRGTEVLGVDLGGKSRSEAVKALRAHLAARSDRFATPVAVKIGAQTARINPADVGLGVDAEATVSAAAAATPSVTDRLFGSHTVEPVVTVDAARLDAALRKTAAKATRPPRMPAVVFQGTTPKPVYPQPGTGLDPARSAQALREGWLTGQPVTVPLVELLPTTTATDVDQLIADFAQPAVSGPVTVNTSRGGFAVPPSTIARSLRLGADKTGKITPRVDEKTLRTALEDQLAKVETKPKEATVAIQGGKPRVIASTGGHQVDTVALSRDLLSVLPKQDGREVKGHLKPIQPKTTTGDLARLGIKERVSTFTTKFTGGLSSSRSQNIVRIAQEVDGAVVKPGETFSLNGHTGERGIAQGYKEAPVILDGKLVPGVGGGASQFTTTLFNASYYAGLEDVEHKPHSYWFSRYPPVIESTIFYPDLDFKFRNDTPYGVLIDTSHTASTITVSIWSTRVYDSVTTQWSARRNTTKPKVIHLPPGPSCIPTAGIDGFTQDAWRIFRKNGKELRREKFTWRYDAEPTYICAKKPA
ncbi:MAG TPA: VanW family protein [Pilimelia sp.]|nr:VanW family protein [Pilimelia sp.]